MIILLFGSCLFLWCQPYCLSFSNTIPCSALPQPSNSYKIVIFHSESTVRVWFHPWWSIISHIWPPYPSKHGHVYLRWEKLIEKYKKDSEAKTKRKPYPRQLTIVNSEIAALLVPTSCPFPPQKPTHVFLISFQGPPSLYFICFSGLIFNNKKIISDAIIFYIYR